MSNAVNELAKATPAGTIAVFLIELLEDITADWDSDPISESTELGSLGIESINLVYLLAEAQQEYRLGDLLMAKLRAERIDIRLLSTRELAEIVAQLCVASAGKAEQ